VLWETRAEKKVAFPLYATFIILSSLDLHQLHKAD
jgi:hypothetical protein